MKIVSLNIRHGGGPRLCSIEQWLNAQLADFILLTEWRNNIGGQVLKSSLEKSGYETNGTARSSTSNGVLLASKTSCAYTRLTPPTASNGEIVACDLEDGTRILCCYFPQMLAKAPFFEVCQKQAVTENSLMIIGDLNTGRNDIDLENGATKFTCARQFIELSETGKLVDLWRRSNYANSTEWTWRSSKNGFRIDHAFANEILLNSFPETRCFYDHSTRSNGLTDHSGLIVELLQRS